MRVIAGKAKGTKLLAPKGLAVRPTTDRVKENIFNIIWSLLGKEVAGTFSLSGMRVLDLYAGAGSLGIEALSRGAIEAVFVDNYLPAVNCLAKNLANTKLAEKAQVLKVKVEAGLSLLQQRQQFFNLIFLDPPFTIGSQELQKVLEATESCLAPSGVVVLEHSPRQKEFNLRNLTVVDQRVYGDEAVSFLKRPGER